ncbi:hypothetical protein NS228_26310 [Methylobacterium indicum]|uniref:DUF3237 domain-containing protein n=1 Tax=Methylobacterium indicum TaxID=1775910 RepID=UPI000734C4A4|nr:DUF3237 domain-containing protein [Methylobacterium indicum]KTS24198.1 hypothetical protein NS229_22045 [Methylobacterium indicum]KTS25078.1 hypothetical protein NS228_26310 [Methylobacterium indicum]KTS47521.1 hypothetical protein NS230_20985 [Methylobacterium indicum]
MMTIPAPALEHVFDARILVAVPYEVGETTAGSRRVIAITGGTVSGPGLAGRVLPGGADYQTIAADGLTQLHARYVVEAEDGARIYVENTGLRFGPPEALERLRRGEPVDPALIYFRSAPRFETAAPRLAWMQTSLFLATGARAPDHVALSVYRVA